MVLVYFPQNPMECNGFQYIPMHFDASHRNPLKYNKNCPDPLKSIDSSKFYAKPDQNPLKALLGTRCALHRHSEALLRHS